MATSTMMRAMTIGGALVLAASGVLGGGVADAGGGIASCTPTTRTLDTLAGSLPSALSAAGHVVTTEYLRGSNIRRHYLHDPDGTKTPIVDGDKAPTGAADVNSRGVVAGTERYQAETGIYLYQPWVFRRGHVRLLANPGKLGHGVRKDYYAVAVNGRSAAVGVKTNSDRFTPADPEYVARPVLWPTPASTPIKLDLPGGFSVNHTYGHQVDLLADGTITAVLDDANGGRHLALWVTPGADPALRPLPDGWLSTDIAGQWVTGHAAPPSGDMFVMSWTTAFTVGGDRPIRSPKISPNGTYFGSQHDEFQISRTVVGAPGTSVRDVGRGMWASDVAGTLRGQLLVYDTTSISVLSCALSLPEATDIAVTSVELPPTKVAP